MHSLSIEQTRWDDEAASLRVRSQRRRDVSQPSWLAMAVFGAVMAFCVVM